MELATDETRANGPWQSTPIEPDPRSARDLIEQAERLLNEWLVDNTDEVFEEQPEIDEARGLLLEALERMFD